jgi:NTP pyrophosphatase (non-canonical NTP hydrolase)
VEYKKDFSEEKAELKIGEVKFATLNVPANTGFFRAMPYGYDLYQFQQDALASAVYPDQGKLNGLIYAVLGLTGEAGELANKLKKHLRSGTSVDNQVLLDEAGDVQWYLAAVARELNSTLNQMAEMNIKKLRQRVATNTVKQHE